jgi:hypothetical protein
MLHDSADERVPQRTTHGGQTGDGASEADRVFSDAARLIPERRARTRLPRQPSLRRDAEARMTDRIPRNEAIDIVGKAQFGAAWIGELTQEEWALTQKYKLKNSTRPKVPADIANKLYDAEERAARADRQHRDVIHWLENHGLDCVRGLKDGLDREAFCAAFYKGFGKNPDTMSPRDRAVLNRLKSGKLPGEKDGPGSEYWSVFQQAIQREIGSVEGTSLKQLRRVVNRLRREHHIG